MNGCSSALYWYSLNYILICNCIDFLQDEDSSSPYVPLKTSQKEYEDIARRYARQPSMSSLYGVDNPTFNDPDAITVDPHYSKNHSRHPIGASSVSSSSRKSSVENVTEQNYANNAYEMRAKQTNLAGMGALSHRSAQNLNTSGMTGNAARRVRLSRSIPEVEEEESAVDGWEFPRDKLYFREKLGEGAFGEVWRASAEGITDTTGMTTVAVKQVRGKPKLVVHGNKSFRYNPNDMQLYCSLRRRPCELPLITYFPLSIEINDADEMNGSTQRRTPLRRGKYRKNIVHATGPLVKFFAKPYCSPHLAVDG